MKISWLLLLLFLSSCAAPILDEPTIITTFQESGLDCSWDPSGSNRILYSQKGTDTYYDIHLSYPDGTEDTCLTCDHPALPNKHIANMAWSYDGKWCIFVAEKAVHPGSSTDALPGFGAYCDIWIMRVDSSAIFKIVDIPNDYDHGVICPRFSPDMTKISWTDRVEAPNVLDGKKLAGYWVIKTADFAFDSTGVPVVSNVQIVPTGEPSFYECYGFSPDNQRLIYCSSVNQPSFWDQHIYTINVDGTNIQKLTDKNYNEHGFYRPDGNKIVWMSNTESKAGGTDWWMMNSDGSDKKRLSYMNEPKNGQYAGHAVWAGLGSFDPVNQNRFISGVQLDLISQEGKIVIVEILP